MACRGARGAVSVDLTRRRVSCRPGTARLLRPGFAGAPLMPKSEPHDLDQALFDRLDQVLDACERHSVRVVVAPHTFPDLRDGFTTFPDNEFWQDFRYPTTPHLELLEHDFARKCRTAAARSRTAGNSASGRPPGT